MEIDETETNPASNESNDNNLKDDMFNHICGLGNKVFFKSQQIDEPELSADEKKHILDEIFARKHSLFLARFGSHIHLGHLIYFRDKVYDNDEETFNVKYYVNKIEKNINRAKIETKNRRYAAMEKLIEENEYFTEVEMMNRQPLLYEQLVGKYLTAREKKERDHEVNASVSNAFFGVLDRKEKNERQERQQQEESDDESAEENLHSEDEDDDCSMNEEETFSRSQWGCFDDEKQKTLPQPVQKKIPKKESKSKTDYITATERELLREEFLGIMYSKFLSGEDEDVDYTCIDNNPEYDKIEYENQDEEDKYFDSEMAAEDDDENTEMDKQSENKSSEDELDVYMRHLNQHQKVVELSDQFHNLRNQ